MADFDIQAFLENMRAETSETLREMREEHKEGISTVTTRVDTVLGISNNHETRIVVLEGTRKSLRWFFGAVIVAILGALGTYIASYIPHP